MRINSIFTVFFLLIAINMATKLTYTYSLNSALTLTLKFQGQMMNFYVFRMYGPICTK